jgi:NAD(P)-dependent dehydrogenase (short-subunit alcohol dehydrogenase family)
MSSQKYPTSFPQQHDEAQPGREHKMQPEPFTLGEDYRAGGKLRGKKALITGGDSGIGRSVAIHFAKEGADVAIIYLAEDQDAEEAKRLCENQGVRCYTYAGDLGDPATAKKLTEQAISDLGGLDVLVNNAAEQHLVEEITDIPDDQIARTFRTNVFSLFYVTKAAMPHLSEGASIINSCSVVAFKGNPVLLDYASTKGAIVAFTRSLSGQLAEKGIRVNSVAPGPIWTPFITDTMPADQVEEFGQNVPLGRAGQPEELAPAYVYLACRDSSYVTGQTIHVNGGSVVGA